MALSLIEPVESLGKEPGRNERDDSIAARGRFLVGYDNITTVSQNTSDWLCRLVTGVTDDRRALYSDDDLRPIAYKRSGVATSITVPAGLGSDNHQVLLTGPNFRAEGCNQAIAQVSALQQERKLLVD